MDLVLSVEPDESGALLAELRGWLRAEEGLRGQVHPQLQDPAPGEMGPVSDALLIAVGAGGALSVFAASLRSWFAQPRRSDVRITVKDGAGREITVDARRVSDVEGLLRRTLEVE